MSIYDYRDTPAYRDFDVPISYCNNQYINSWWTEEHDKMILTQIELEQWNWHWDISNVIVSKTSPNAIEKWRDNDPFCKQYAWYNALMYYSVAKAKKQGYLKRIRKAEWKKCHLCNNDFIENSLPSPFVKKLGINNLDFCAPCLRDSLLDEGDGKMSKSDIIDFVTELAKILNKVPPQNFVNEISNLSEYELIDRIELLKHLQTKPTLSLVKKTFGSWFHLLIEAEILEDGTRKNSRGIQCLAKDGHICLSLGEKTIDDLLFEFGVNHSKEPHYPEGNYRGDFLVGDIIIEYFGLIGNPEYDKKVELKRKLAQKYCLSVIEIFPVDLINTKKLVDKLMKRLGLNPASPDLQRIGIAER